MKSLLMLMICLSLYSCMEDKETHQKEKIQTVETQKSDLPEEIQQEEDCDDKAAKIEEEEIDENNLFGADEGCTLEE